jgi:hypothetical protein
MAKTRPLPDPDVSLRDARDFIVSTALVRKALRCRWNLFPVAVHDLIEVIHRLVQSCHLPEFTDHGLPHLCSLVDRIDQWELPESVQQRTRKRYWHETKHASPDHCATILVATLLHDLGMLSQSVRDLPDESAVSLNPSAWTNTADWVRSTHVDRLPGLVRRLVGDELGYDKVVGDERFQDGMAIACAHARWPWEWKDQLDQPALRGLAAILAVADLLDEDSSRCDAHTLLRHREGTLLNRAHWLRHGLTEGRLTVQSGSIAVTMLRPPGCPDADLLRSVFSALRNHFRLVELYRKDLRSVDADITHVQFHPSTGVPSREAPLLSGWEKLPGFANPGALCYQLLTSFMPHALRDEHRLEDEDMQELRTIGLEEVDVSALRVSAERREPTVSEERAFYAILGSDF